jgi:serine/threonine protein kinase
VSEYVYWIEEWGTLMKSGVLERCPQCQSDLTKARAVMEGEELSFCPKCNFPLRLIANKYQLERVLGKGGFGTVYLARHIHLIQDAERVVKILPSEVLKAPGMKERFFREVQLTSILSMRDEHIVRVYDDFGELPGLGHFYVMEYLQGTSLDELVAQPQRLPAMEFCFHIFRQLCDTMQMAHESHVIHRDLKPENIFLVKRKRDKNFLKVLDFGIARPMNLDEFKRTGLTQGALGTPFYMAPEQCLNREVDERTDLYSIGVILYELLVGYTPFDPRMRNRPMASAVEILMDTVGEAPPPPGRFRPDRVNEKLERFLLKALSKNPKDRFQSAREMRETFDKIHTPLSQNSVWDMARFDLTSISKGNKVSLRVDDFADVHSETQLGDSQELLTPLPSGDAIKEAEDSKVSTLPTGLLPTDEEIEALPMTYPAEKPSRQQAQSLVRSDILARTMGSDEVDVPAGIVSSREEVVVGGPPGLSDKDNEAVAPPESTTSTPKGRVVDPAKLKLQHRASESNRHPVSNAEPHFVFKEREPEPSRTGLWTGIVAIVLLTAIGGLWFKFGPGRSNHKAPSHRRILAKGPIKSTFQNASEVKAAQMRVVDKWRDFLSKECRNNAPDSTRGTLTLRWTVLPSGRVGAFEKVADSIHSAGFRTCIKRRILRWKFHSFATWIKAVEVQTSVSIASRAARGRRTAPPPRKRRKPRRVIRRKKLRRQPPRRRIVRKRFPVSGCPAAMKNTRWVRLKLSPKEKFRISYSGKLLRQRGSACLLLAKPKTIVTIKADKYDTCRFTLKKKHQTVRIKMNKESDDGMELGGSYCLKK